MDEFFRVALRRDEVVPAAGDVGGGVEAEDRVGEGIAMMMVIEEPAINFIFAEGLLDGEEIELGLVCGLGDGVRSRSLPLLGEKCAKSSNQKT